ncbi:ARHGDI [Lepeophtheirus salmonis]|uniref:ARHGDI n=1 Tax=Lepeophtheirus salmonis TaxID=72036 RepID=A0A7R8CAT3_LEPSM|nr:ARHGDI [Lepeophtheirus salmonis]CAF2754364.1 ARHGDI [Lepeophtheirus salmonis]
MHMLVIHFIRTALAKLISCIFLLTFLDYFSEVEGLNMSEEEIVRETENLNMEDDDEIDKVEGSYRPPKEKTVEEILKADEDDESLRRYKAKLIPSSSPIIIEADNPNNVIVKQLALVVEGRPDEILDLTQGLDAIKNTTFVIKEGIEYRIRIDFMVQRDIVTGLKYVQKTTRKGFPVDKLSHMCGSYPPKNDVQCNFTQKETAPSGLTGRVGVDDRNYLL